MRFYQGKGEEKNEDGSKEIGQWAKHKREWAQLVSYPLFYLMI